MSDAGSEKSEASGETFEERNVSLLTSHVSPSAAPTSPTWMRRRWPVILILLAGITAFAWYRVGMLDLPAVPAGLTAEGSGLVDLVLQLAHPVDELPHVRDVTNSLPLPLHEVI